ncbi:hypothetical protein ACFQUU_16050 [Herbaspirillum sp. GCM10030257]|uniref:hypothetical protein n=1 Tax=Herbaspirillum sp. GCM10030257 TaxID=3273393 RepID=UPI0036116FFE
MRTASLGSIAAAVTFLLSACGGGGDAAVTQASTTEVNIVASRTNVEPMTPIMLSVTNSTGQGLALPANGLTVQISAASDFADPLEVTAIPKAQDKVLVSIPDSSGLIVGSPVNQPFMAHLRVKRNSDNALSNPLTINVTSTVLDDRFSKPGQATVFAGLLAKAIARASGDPSAIVYAGSENVASRTSMAFDSLRQLGADTTSLDILAQQYINAILGDHSPTATASSSSNTATAPVKMLARTRFLSFAEDYANTQAKCISDNFATFNISAIATELKCDVDQVARNALDFNSKLESWRDSIVSWASVGFKIANRIGAKTVSAGFGFFANMGEKNFVLDLSAKMATFGMRATIDGRDAALQIASENAANSIYSDLTGEFGKTLHDISTGTGFEQKFNDSLSEVIKGKTVAAAENIQRKAQDLQDAVNDAAAAAENFLKKKAPKVPGQQAAGTSAICSALGVDCPQTESTKPITVDELCGPLGGPDATVGGAAGLPAVTCRQMQAAFSDPSFAEEELESFAGATEEEINALTAANNALLACLQATPVASDACAPESKAVEEANAPVLNKIAGVLGAVQGFTAKEFNCPAGYTNRGSMDKTSPHPLLCSHSSLIVNTTSCPNGSYDAMDKGIRTQSTTCLWFDRDFFQPGRTCRPGYSKALYHGYETCRWSGLRTGQPAVQAVDRKTGKMSIIRD